MYKGWNEEEHVSPYLMMDKYRQAYERPIHCTRGAEMWERYSGPKLEAPICKRWAGGRNKKRKRCTGEPRQEPNSKFARLSRDGIQGHCTHCGEQGHNMRTCAAKKAGESNQGDIPHPEGGTSVTPDEDTTPATPPSESAGRNENTAADPIPPKFFPKKQTEAPSKTTSKNTKPAAKSTSKTTNAGAGACGMPKTTSTMNAGAKTCKKKTSYDPAADEDVCIVGVVGSCESGEAQAFRRILRQTKRRSNNEKRMALERAAARAATSRK